MGGAEFFAVGSSQHFRWSFRKKVSVDMSLFFFVSVLFLFPFEKGGSRKEKRPSQNTKKGRKKI
jgi:ABC-type transport system involved in cytochrome c biogenesis permease component